MKEEARLAQVCRRQVDTHEWNLDSALRMSKDMTMRRIARVRCVRGGEGQRRAARRAGGGVPPHSRRKLSSEVESGGGQCNVGHATQ